MTVISITDKNKWNQIQYIVLCDCGTIKSILRSDLLRDNGTKSCGCLQKEHVTTLGMNSAYTLIGKRFERLLVIKRVGSKNNAAMWLCKCDCGNEIITISNLLVSGHTRSCGCLRIDVVTERNHSDSAPVKRPEVRAKISASRTGLLLGEKNPFYGKHHTEETRIKMSKAKENLYLGKNNPNWHGGKSFEPYCYKFNEPFRKYVRNKFNNICFVCGNTVEDNNNREMSIHHIDYNKNNICKGKSWAFITLCTSCHTKTNYNRWYWFNLFINYWLDNNEIHLNKILEVSL